MSAHPRHVITAAFGTYLNGNAIVVRVATERWHKGTTHSEVELRSKGNACGFLVTRTITRGASGNGN